MRDERFLDVAQLLAVAELHAHARVRHDGADRLPVPLRDAAVGHRGAAVGADHHAAILGIGVEARAAVHDEVERPLPLRGVERAIRVRAADFAQQRVRLEAAAERAGDEVLHEHVERAFHRHARLDAPLGRRGARGRGFDQLQRLRRHHGDLRDLAGTMPAAARALQQARDALGTADLQHLVHRREVDAEVEARRADDGAQLAVADRVLDPFAHVAVERAVMQRDLARPSPDARRAAPGTRSRRPSARW